MVNKWTEENMYGLDAFVMDYLLRFEPTDTTLVRASPSIEATQAPVLGVQIGLTRESLTNTVADASSTMLSVNESRLGGGRPRSHASTPNHLVEIVRHEEAPTNYGHHYQQAVLNDQVPEHENHEPTVSHSQVKQVHNVQQQQQHQRVVDALAFVTEEMQLKVAYELQVWKEAREKEIELNVSSPSGHSSLPIS